LTTATEIERERKRERERERWQIVRECPRLIRTGRGQFSPISSMFMEL